MRFELDPLTSPAVRELIATHLALMHAQSPPGAVHALEIDRLRSPSIRFWSAWIESDLVGCGALKRLSATDGEIKSMHVLTRHRRLGVAGKILAHIEHDARTSGLTRLWLETGAQPTFAPARSFYARAGYEPCGPFGDYAASPHSTFMTKPL